MHRRGIRKGRVARAETGPGAGEEIKMEIISRKDEWRDKR